MNDRPALSIGSTVWVFDENRRIYPKGAPSQRYVGGGPIWREHWCPREIVGETRVSWITDRGERLRKRRGVDARYHDSYLVSEAEIDTACYANEHAHRIAAIISGSLKYRNPELVAQVARLIGYDHPPITKEHKQ